MISGELFQEKKKLLIFLIFFISLTVVASYLMINSQKVSARIIPVTVNVQHLDFGTVFPGEELEGNFIVTYVDEGDGIVYMIIQERKLLPEEHPEYPSGGDPEMPGYYRNLCPFLTKASNEGEGDTENEAFVGPNDISDTWTIYFSVPAIFGKVAQDHTGGVVDVNGEYGCDISIDVEGCEFGETQPCDTGLLGICVDGTQTCDENGYWGACIQDNQPTTEICDDGLDNNCDGYTDCDDEGCFQDPGC